jgi:hypothetical protein
MVAPCTLRGVMPVAPMHLAHAPDAGSGKSYLAEIASVIATGEGAMHAREIHRAAGYRLRIDARRLLHHAESSSEPRKKASALPKVPTARSSGSTDISGAIRRRLRGDRHRNAAPGAGCQSRFGMRPALQDQRHNLGGVRDLLIANGLAADFD